MVRRWAAIPLPANVPRPPPAGVGRGTFAEEPTERCGVLTLAEDVSGDATIAKTQNLPNDTRRTGRIRMTVLICCGT